MTTLGDAHTQQLRHEVLNPQQGYVLDKHTRGTDFAALAHLTNSLKISMDQAFSIIHREPQKEATARFLGIHGYEFTQAVE